MSDGRMMQDEELKALAREVISNSLTPKCRKLARALLKYQTDIKKLNAKWRRYVQLTEKRNFRAGCAAGLTGAVVENNLLSEEEEIEYQKLRLEFGL